MVTIRTAETRDLDELVRLEGELFATDAAAHEPLADPTWPTREGRRDFERLLADNQCLVLVADLDGATIGLLVGYLAGSSPTRLPSTYAVLRSLYVDTARQRQGVGTALVDAFVRWARTHDCAEAHVDAYAANVGAHAFYERHGFAVRSISRALTL
jgi:ribosomal protein S18 acetylase RimI-like enzyme